MFRREPSTAEQVAALRVDMIEVLAKQRLRERQHSEAVAAEVSALHLLDSARAVQGQCTVKITGYIDAIRSLQDEIDALIPKPRQP